MPYTLKTNQISVKDPETGEYSGVDILAEQTEQGLIAELQAEGTTQVNRINQAAVDVQSAVDKAETDAAKIISDTQTSVNTLESQKNTIAQTVASMAQLGTDTTLTTPGMAADAAACGDLKNALSKETGNIHYAYTVDKSISKTDLPNQATENGWESVGIPCSGGDIFYVKGKGGISTRLWMFCDSEGTLLRESDSNLLASDYVRIVAPNDSAYLCVNNKMADAVAGVFSKELLRNNTNKNHYEIRQTEQNSGVLPILLEKGNISIYTNGWIYGDINTRVRTVRGTSIPLKAGNVIGFKKWSGIKMYIGYLSVDGYYKTPASWLTEDYTVQEDGDYIILMRKDPEVAVTVDDFIGNFQITVPNSIISLNYAGTDFIKSKINSNVKSILHRGASGYPENTLIAYKQGKKLGFDIVECDVRFTKEDDDNDAVAVLLHDTTINRTARNADGTSISSSIAIANITYADVLDYDFGIYAGEQFAGIKIPTFKEFILLCKSISIHPYIEVKEGTETQVLSLLQIVKDCGMIDNVTWISDVGDRIQPIVDAYDKARVGLVVSNVLDWVITRLNQLKTGSNEVFAFSSGYGDTAIGKCKTANIPLEVWIVNTVSDLLALDPYITGVESDVLNAQYVMFVNNMY